ncbi:MAG: RNA methyltransferase [Paludibacteraceae bacterium]
MEEFKQRQKIPLVIILDSIRSLHNVGSIFRTSDAFLIEKIYLCGITSTPPHAEIHKTALGAENSVDWEYVEDCRLVVKALKENNYRVYSIEQTENSVMLPDFTPHSACKAAIVLGNEVKGVQQSVIDICDGSIEIPQYGTKHSLNVSVAAGIAIWEMALKFKQ